MEQKNDENANRKSPLISVIMPVYNAALYLRKAIESVLNQTFTNFEFLIVDDGSSDGSDEIVMSFNDVRIIYLKNAQNLGLISTLNNAIKLARGKYIARMDNDDLCFPERFELQLKYFSLNPKAKMICSPVHFINGDGKDSGVWIADRNAKSYQQIISTLPWENCIAHPSIMIDADLLRKYQYRHNQKGSEDWDLWLRLARDQIQFVKTNEPLLYYRVHSHSFTRLYNKRYSAQIKAIKVKLKFVGGSLRQFKINTFVIRTFITIYKDLGYYIKTSFLPIFLRKIKWSFTINPFKAYKQYRLLNKSLSENRSSHFFFFPYSHIGGAEKVHAEITKVARAKKPFVFITGLADEGTHISQFGEDCFILPVSKALYHPLFAGRSEKLILNKIQSNKEPVVFGCNNLFFYELLKKVDPKIYVADLTHDFDYEKDKVVALKHLQGYLHCNARIFISNATVKKTQDFYTSNFVEAHYLERLHIIYNYVNAPSQENAIRKSSPIRILYVGRDTDEKRVDIIFELANFCEKQKLGIDFMFVGDIRQRKKFAHLKNLQFMGIIRDTNKLSATYATAHFVIITSSSEGFPLTLAEGMIHGCIPISTKVGDVPFHIKNNENGLLIDGREKDLVIENVSKLVIQIAENSYDLKKLSQMAHNYAIETFKKVGFNEAYRKILKID